MPNEPITLEDLLIILINNNCTKLNCNDKCVEWKDCRGSKSVQFYANYIREHKPELGL